MTRDALRNAVTARLNEMNTALATLDDTAALALTVLFPVWAANTQYVVDDRIRYNGKLYRVVQSHTSQSDWAPDVTPALWTEVAEPGTIPVWRQPTGAQDAYMQGDLVHFPTAADTVYINTMDFNTYAPNVYGWELYEKEV